MSRKKYHYGAVGPSQEWATCWEILHGGKLHRFGRWEENKLFKQENSSFIAALFGLSGLIGVYFWRKGDQTTPEETLLGEHFQLGNMKYKIWEKWQTNTRNVFWGGHIRSIKSNPVGVIPTTRSEPDKFRQEPRKIINRNGCKIFSRQCF